MINHFEKLSINNSTQYALVRGMSVDNPLLIHVQQGPGAPMISEAKAMEKNLHLEKDFLVAYWDQRGCGLSYNDDVRPETVTLAQMSDDLIVFTRYLLGKYNKKKAIILGYSMGATISVMAAAKEGNIFSAVVATGIDVDVPYANHYALEYALNRATGTKREKKLVEAINELKSQPIVDSVRFQKRALILTDLGGIKANTSFNQLVLTSVGNMLFSKHYGIRGLIRGIKGLSFCQNALVQELNNLDLFQGVTQVPVPVHFVQGSLDAIAPPQKSREYFERLVAPQKTFTVFENSAHMPQYDEPGKFANLIRSIGRNQPEL